MSEFQLQTIEEQEISQWDINALKTQLDSALEGYRNVVYTDEKSAKGAKSEINKVKKLIEDKRKEYKKRCLAPYEAAEPELKALVSMLDAQVSAIDAAVKEFELDRQNEKETAVKDIFMKKSVPLGEYAARLYIKNFSKKWINATTSLAAVEQEIITLVNTALGEIEQIKALNSPYEQTLLDEYAERSTLDEVLKRNEELTQINERAGISAAAQETVAVKRNVEVSAEGVLLRVFADKKQLDQIMDFMDAIGVGFRVE